MQKHIFAGTPFNTTLRSDQVYDLCHLKIVI